MTLRDYFAGQALAEIDYTNDPEVVANEAYQVADAMLEERGGE